MRILLRPFIITLACMFAALEARACTTFCIRKGDQLVFGKNFDFHTGVGHLIVNKRGVRKVSFDLPPEKPLEWVSKYGSVTFNQMGREFPYGGMNERGLVIEIMWLADTRYPEPDKRSGLTELQWIQYQLDNAATVQDIIASDAFLRISKLSLAPVHFLACDAKGNVTTIEYVDGTMVYHTGATLPVCALSNDTYDLSTKYMSSLTDLKTRTFTSGSYDRFSEAASRVQDFKGGNAIDYSFDILDDVSQGNFTRWSIVYDIRNMRIHYKTQNNKDERVLDITEFDYNCASPALYIDIDQNLNAEASGFLPYSPHKNRALIDLAFSKVDFLQAVPKEERGMVARYPESTKCK